MAWRFDESIARKLQDFHAIGLNENDIIELTQAFHVCGFWRVTLDDGLIFGTENVFKIFEMEPHAGPMNFQCVNAKVIEEDKDLMLEAFQRSSETGQTFHSIFRLGTKNGTVKWVRSVGKHHIREDGVAEMRGMLHELFEHLATAAFVIAPSIEGDKV
ncbi:PAS domain-containing protein [Rhizobium sp.]|uniref:PAS domain-containing protein n=1 Tax=Rhizobium sp. TaxID=391 RepID=UPI002AA66202